MNVPLQLDWQAKIGAIIQTGRGLLSPALKLRLTEIEEFKVAVGNLIAGAYPQRGEIHLANTLVCKCDCRTPHKLIWFWRMEKTLSSGPDKNNGAFSFVCYGLGLECDQNKFGVRFLSDGSVQPGLE